MRMLSYDTRVSRAHGSHLAVYVCATLATLAAAGFVALAAPRSAAAAEVRCAQEPRGPTSLPAVHFHWEGEAPEEHHAVLHVGLLCGPESMLGGLLGEGYSYLAPDVAAARSAAAAAATPGILPDFALLGAPVALAVGAASFRARPLATFSLGPASIYSDLHFSPGLALRLRPDSLRLPW